MTLKNRLKRMYARAAKNPRSIKGFSEHVLIHPVRVKSKEYNDLLRIGYSIIPYKGTIDILRKDGFVYWNYNPGFTLIINNYDWDMDNGMSFHPNDLYKPQ